jgi:hypothetical protein
MHMARLAAIIGIKIKTIWTDSQSSWH